MVDRAFEAFMRMIFLCATSDSLHQNSIAFSRNCIHKPLDDIQANNKTTINTIKFYLVPHFSIVTVGNTNKRSEYKSPALSVQPFNNPTDISILLKSFKKHIPPPKMMNLPETH